MISNNKKDEEKKGKVNVGDLKLNKETVKDLPEAEAKKIKGGAKAGPGRPPESSCAKGCLSWSVNYCPE
jgi:hypothetical protein